MQKTGLIHVKVNILWMYMFINLQCKWKRGNVKIFTCQILKDDYIFYDVL